MKASLFYFSIAVCILSATCQAQSSVAACPPLMEQMPPAAPAGTQWIGMIYKGGGVSRLESIMVFDGHPSEMASLRPGQTKQTKKEMTSIWLLDQSEERRGFWLACTYSNSSGIFAIPLAPNIQQCRITQRVVSGHVAEMTSFECS